jgi:acetyltransferase-like isoleucine patch superfamily enzyme
MAFLPLRPVPLPGETDLRYGRWLDSVRERLDDPAVDRNDLCRQILTGLYLPGLAGIDPDTLDPDARLLVDQLDPRNVTLEPEYYRELDVVRYARVKPLLWLWEMFDRSPAGENTALGVPFRRLLAERVFRRCGHNFKAFPYVRVSFGYNLEVGDDVVVHRHVLLDDRGGIRIGNGVSVSDFANVYSHTHDIVDGRQVFMPETVIEDGVRITYHATILAGAHVRRDSMVGAMAVLTRDTDERWVYVGIPARPVKQKSAAALAARPPSSHDPLAGDAVTAPDEAGEG